jgi:Putative adhesin
MNILRTSFATTTICGVIAIGSIGCSEALGRVEVSSHQTVPAARALEIHNTAGTIDIVPWTQSTVEIDARRRGPTLADAQAIAINVTRSDSKVVITTNLGDGLSRNVFFTIHAPAKADLIIDETAGTVNITGWAGSVDATQTAGNLDVAMARLDAPQHMTLHATTGDLVLLMPGSSNATIDAQTRVGSVSADEFGLTTQRENLTGASAHGTIGHGGAHVELRVTTGAISLRLQR